MTLDHGYKWLKANPTILRISFQTKGTVNRGIGRPKLTVSVKLVKSLLFAVGVVIYQNDGKDVYFAELLSDFMCMRFYWLQSWIKAQIWKIVFWGNSRPPTKISLQSSLLAKTVNFKWLSAHRFVSQSYSMYRSNLPWPIWHLPKSGSRLL